MVKHHLNVLTWLRAIAAMLVIVTHVKSATYVAYSANDEPSYSFAISLLDLGDFAVYLFFALSGCTLFISNSQNLKSLGSFGDFFIKRFMRIWPLFAISMLFYMVFIEIFRNYYNSDMTYWISNFLKEYNFINILQYLSLTFNITGPKYLFQGPYWSLPVEFQYYLMLPFCVYLMRGVLSSFFVPALFSAVLYALYKTDLLSFNDSSLFKMGFSFFGGVVLAKLYQLYSYRIPLWGSLLSIVLTILAVGLVQVAIIEIPPSLPFVADKWNFFGLAAVVCVFFALFAEERTVKNPVLDFLSFYGEISYSVYLFHMMFVGAAVLLVIHLGITGGTEKLLFVLALSFVGSFVFSIFTYKYIEKPFIQLGRLLATKKKVESKTSKDVVEIDNVGRKPSLD
ncbi:MAG: acyltransferase [Cellvibrio sp.]|uniref:acyltransferase family protein n=1 Tax=Cellvibrio sp. TaxID=1965322 RepID=UPI0031A2DC58